ncbi:hypothetical protein D3C72_1627080 [compost metagenome]
MQILKAPTPELGGQKGVGGACVGNAPVALLHQQGNGGCQRLAPLGAHGLDVGTHQRRPVHGQHIALVAQSRQKGDGNGLEGGLHHAGIEARQALEHRERMVRVVVRQLQHPVPVGRQAVLQTFDQHAPARNADGAAQQQHRFHSGGDCRRGFGMRDFAR